MLDAVHDDVGNRFQTDKQHESRYLPEQCARYYDDVHRQDPRIRKEHNRTEIAALSFVARLIVEKREEVVCKQDSQHG